MNRYSSIQIGHVKSTLAGTIAEQSYETENVITDTITLLEQAIDRNSKLITGNQGGYVVFRYDSNGHPYEILIMDNPDISQAQKVWRWNNSGLGYSSTGYEGTYRLGMNMDGQIVADLITAGTMTANLIKAGVLTDVAGKFSLNMQTGDLLMNSGTFKGDIIGGTLEIGGSDTAGAIRVFDEDDNRRGLWNKNGFRLYDDNGNIIFEATSDVSMSGSLHTSDMDIDGAYINYKNGTAFIDFDGSGAQGGVHIRGDKAVFSVNDIGTTGQAGGQSVSYGVSENANCFEFTNGLCTTVRAHGLSGTYTLTDGWGTQWTFEEGLLVSVT